MIWDLLLWFISTFHYTLPLCVGLQKNEKTCYFKWDLFFFWRLKAKLLTVSSFLTSSGETIRLAEIRLIDQNKHILTWYQWDVGRYLNVTNGFSVSDFAEVFKIRTVNSFVCRHPRIEFSVINFEDKVYDCSLRWSCYSFSFLC